MGTHKASSAKDPSLRSLVESIQDHLDKLAVGDDDLRHLIADEWLADLVKGGPDAR